MTSPFDMVPGFGDAAKLLPEIGAHIGYGRAIQILQGAWRQHLLDEKYKFPEATADKACGLVCVWCNTDTRTGKKVRKESRRG